MKIFLLNPPFLKKFSRPQRSPAVTKSGTLYFPMWLAYVTGVLSENGFEVDFVDAPADGYSSDDIIKRVREFQPALIILDTSTPSIYNDAAVAGQLKDYIGTNKIYSKRTSPYILTSESLFLSVSIFKL